MSHKIKKPLKISLDHKREKYFFLLTHIFSLCFVLFSKQGFSQEYDSEFSASYSNDSIIQDELKEDKDDEDENELGPETNFESEKNKTPQTASVAQASGSSIKSNMFALGIGRLGSWQSLWAVSYEKSRKTNWTYAIQYGEGRMDEEGSYKDQIFTMSSKSRGITFSERFFLRKLSGFAVRFQQSLIHHQSKSKRLSFLEDHPMLLLESSREEKNATWNQIQIGVDIAYRWEISDTIILDYSMVGTSWDLIPSILQTQNKSLKSEDPEMHEWVRRQYAEPAIWGFINLSLGYKF